MTQFFEMLEVFFAGGTVWVYVCILFGKIIEVALSTLRIVLINRGERVVGACIALIEIFLWLIIAANVLGDYKTDPLKMVSYAVAYAIGNFLGSWLEERLAFGLCSVQTVIMDKETKSKVCSALRRSGFGVTEYGVMGMDNKKHYMILSILRRKLSQDAIRIVQEIAPNALITVSDVKSQRGGYMRNGSSKTRRKGK